MLNRILVGVTQREDFAPPPHNEMRDVLSHRLIEWLLNVDCLPLPIPNNLIDLKISKSLSDQPILASWLSLMKIQALVLSGGDDIGESQNRDLLEKFLLTWAQDNRIPVLGICRGMQIMGVWSGSPLISIPGHVRTQHQLLFTDQSDQLPKKVNSFHNQALGKCPENFKVIAKSEDGNIEAIRHDTLSWEGWMWHPERESKFSKEDINRFRKLISYES